MSAGPARSEGPSPGAPLDEPVQALAAGYAYGRIALGVTALAVPGPVARGFGIGEGPSARLAGRYIGGRDLVAGLGMVLGRRHGSARGWYEATAMTDFLDVAITLVGASVGAIPWRRALLVSLLAGGSGAVGLALARSMESAEPTPPATTLD